MLLNQLCETPEDTKTLDRLRHREEFYAKMAGEHLANMVALYAKEQWEMHAHLRSQYDDWEEYLDLDYSNLKHDFLSKFNARVEASFQEHIGKLF